MTQIIFMNSPIYIMSKSCKSTQ